MLHRLSGVAIRRPLLVIVLWAAVLGVGFGVGVGVFGHLTSATGTVPGSESDRADTLSRTAPGAPQRITAVVAGHPADDPSQRAAVAAAVADLRARRGVAAVAEPETSPETGRAVLLQVTLAAGDEDAVRRAAEDAAHRLRRITPGTVTVTGDPLTDHEFGDQAQADVERAELVTIPLVAILLVLIFGGLLAGGTPLVVGTAGVGGSFGLLYAFSRFTDVSVYAIQITTMLATGLAVDYALLMVNRFREARAADPDVPAAVRHACATAGRTVCFSGLTVAAGLAGLVVFDDPFLRSMGLAGVAVVAVDLLAALTLLPALLTLVGRRIRPARVRTGDGVFGRIAAAVQRRPGLTALATVAVVLVIALPVLHLRTAESDARALPAATQTRAQHDALATHFPRLLTPSPVTVVAAADAADPAFTALRTRVAAVPGVTGVEVQALSPTVTVLVVGTADEPTTAAARRTVAGLRALPAPFEVAVGGDAARLVDYRAMLADRAPWAALVVVAATLILLFGFTGSVLLPVKAVLTSALSIGAALGAVVWVFQEGHLVGWFGTVRQDVVDLTVPVLVAAITFGLSVDYEVFLLSRIRERWLAGVPARQAVAEGLQHTGRIVSCAALLLVVVFAGFLTGGFAPIKEIGLGLVLAIALDATIVRMLLVPATMTIAGRYNWWAPAPLRRLHRRIVPG